jgi:PilZ domain
LAPACSTSDRILAIASWGQSVGDERRRTPRFPFAASVEVLETGAAAATSARVTELSLYGCYVEMANPLLKGVEATLRIYAENRYFESQGRVLYSQPSQGMGVGFQNVNPHYLTVLRHWLLEAAQAKFGKKE